MKYRFKSIRGKLLVSFSIVIVLVVLQGIYTFNTLQNTNTATKDVLNREIPLLISDEQLVNYMANRIAAARGYVLTGDKSYKESFDNYTAQSEATQQHLRDLNASQESLDVIDQTVEWRNQITNTVFAEYDRGNEEAAVRNLRATDSEALSLMDSYEKFAQNREEIIINLEKDLLSNGKKILAVTTGIILLVIIIIIVMALLTANSISKPLHAVMERMKLIAGGDLSSAPLETKLQDEIGQLVHSTNEMSRNTHDLLNEINKVAATVSMQSEELTQSANEVKAGTAQIATTMEDLADGAESQATNASSLSSSMESFAAKVTDASDNGNHIQQSSNEVLAMTNDGSRLMADSSKQMTLIDTIVHDAVKKVEGLDKHTQEISELVATIQDIAAQTNLLALNAAIEAARAGEHGKGFAVVADEVRKLAEQSASSVMNITEIVNRIQSESNLVTTSLQDGYKQVEQGTAQIEQTGGTFTEITAAVNDMVKRIHNISEELQEISNSSQEMSGSIQEIAAITEQSAAGVEETSASSEQASSAMEEIAGNSNELAKLAEELNTLVQRFKL